MLVNACPESEDLRFGSIDVADAEVEVELLGVTATGPRRLHPVIDALERKGGSPVRVLRGEATAGRDERGEVLVSASFERPVQQA